MNNNDILFITSKDDEHTDHMIDYFNKNLSEASVIRLNTEDFSTNCHISFDGNKVIIEILDSGKIIDSETVHAVVYRRPKKIITEHIGDKYTQEFVLKQFNAFIKGFYFCTHDSALWVNPLPSLHRAKIKFQQLQLAKKLKFHTPNTLVTNKKDNVINFIEKNKKICMKSLDAPSFVTDNYIYPLYTKIVEKSYILNHLENIEISPIFLQKYIDKKYDIRVVVIGEKLFSFEIHSQEHSDSIVDFRGAILDIVYKEHILPKEIENKIFTFVKKQNLHYSSMDFVLTPDNNYYFIENNPNGQWLWLELETGIDITSHYCNLIMP